MCLLMSFRKIFVGNAGLLGAVEIFSQSPSEISDTSPDARLHSGIPELLNFQQCLLISRFGRTQITVNDQLAVSQRDQGVDFLLRGLSFVRLQYQSIKLIIE